MTGRFNQNALPVFPGLRPGSHKGCSDERLKHDELDRGQGMVRHLLRDSLVRSAAPWGIPCPSIFSLNTACGGRSSNSFINEGRRKKGVDHARLCDKGDDPHAGAARAHQEIDLEDFPDQAGPRAAALPGKVGIVPVLERGGRPWPWWTLLNG